MRGFARRWKYTLIMSVIVAAGLAITLGLREWWRAAAIAGSVALFAVNEYRERG